jgi:amino acid transporter
MRSKSLFLLFIYMILHIFAVQFSSFGGLFSLPVTKTPPWVGGWNMTFLPRTRVVFKIRSLLVSAQKEKSKTYHFFLYGCYVLESVFLFATYVYIYIHYIIYSYIYNYIHYIYIYTYVYAHPPTTYHNSISTCIYEEQMHLSNLSESAMVSEHCSIP